jgi:glutathione S-transferase
VSPNQEEKDMITLYGTGPMFGLPHASPFVIKAEVLLKMSGLPYTLARADLRKAPKGKMPWIDDNGTIVADSAFIRMHLEEKHRIDFSGGYGAHEQGIGWAVNALMEDHVYWLNIQDRWLHDGNFNKGPIHFFDFLPGLVRPVIANMIRRKVGKNVLVHGLGRHTVDERLALGKKAVDAVANILGDNDYILGSRLCGTDATFYGFMASMMCPLFESRLREYAETKPNIVAYLHRMEEQFFAGIQK